MELEMSPLTNVPSTDVPSTDVLSTDVPSTYQQKLRLLFLNAGLWVLLFAILMVVSRLLITIDLGTLIKLSVYPLSALLLLFCLARLRTTATAGWPQDLGIVALLLAATAYMLATPPSALLLGPICFAAILFNCVLAEGVRASTRWYIISALLYLFAVGLRQFIPALHLDYQIGLLLSVYLMPLLLSGLCIRFGALVIQYFDEALRASEQIAADLRQSELQHGRLLQSMNEGFTIVDENGVLRYVNDKFCQIFGYAPEELLNQRSEEVLVYDDANRQVLAQQMALRIERRRSTYELAINRKDGRLVHLLISAVPNIDEDDNFRGATCVVMDITERKQAEAALHAERALLSTYVEERTASLQAATDALQRELQERTQIEAALRKTEEEYRILFDSIPLGIYQSSFDGRQLRVNPALAAINGYTDEAEMLAADNITSEWYVEPGRREKFHQLLAAQGVVRDFESEIYRHKTRERIWVSETAILVRNSENQPLYYQGTVQEITERKRFDEAQARIIDQLAKVARLKDEFLASMSHELRTPLNSILGMAEALQDQIYGELTARQLKALGTIETSGRHLLSLINDILDLAKVESGQIELAHDAVDVAAVCESCVRLIQPVATKKNITVEFSLDCSVKVLMADGRRLKQMLINLLSNAQKFTPDGGTIGLDVTATHAPAQVSFAVWDTGVGIPENARDHLFEPFVQVDSSLSRSYEGTGLGLALVKGMAQLHGGDVAVESIAGEGSRFVVTLPWLLPESTAEQPEQEPSATLAPVPL